jgi:hypothetical protein
LIAVLVAAAFANDRETWTAWKEQWGRNYASNGEDQLRFRIFQSNIRKAQQMTAVDSASYGATKFADLTSQEFLDMYTGLNATSYAKWVDAMPAFNLKGTGLGTDWKAKDLVSKVKDQGSCGSCWAFSATAAAEGCYAVKFGKSIDLSAQQIVDCCSAGGSDGCNGGWQDSALQWAMGEDIATWSSYPYKGYKGTCQAAKTVGLEAGTCTYHSVKGEDKIMTALEHSTVGVAIDATPLQLYTGGIISSQCSYSSVNHAVLLVADEEVLTLKNSWGASWGEKGFWRMKKGVDCLYIGYRAALAY